MRSIFDFFALFTRLASKIWVFYQSKAPSFRMRLWVNYYAYFDTGCRRLQSCIFDFWVAFDMQPAENQCNPAYISVDFCTIYNCQNEKSLAESNYSKRPKLFNVDIVLGAFQGGTMSTVAVPHQSSAQCLAPLSPDETLRNRR